MSYRRWQLAILSGLLLALVTAAPAHARVAFHSAVPLNNNAASDTTLDQDPHVVTDGAGTWVAAWSSTELGVAVARSTDAGATWTAPARIGDGGEARLTTDGAGTWIAVWSYRPTFLGDTDIYVARSFDGGATWTVPVPLNTNAASDAAEDRRPKVTTDATGTWVAVWQSIGAFGSDEDILFARSLDAGATWSAPLPLNTDATTDPSNAFDQEVELATDRMGLWIAVWTGNADGDNDIMAARSNDGGATWTPPAAVNDAALTDTRFDGNARIATDRAGTWVVVWVSKAHSGTVGDPLGADADVMTARSIDGGVTWSSAVPVNSDAAIDAGDDFSPQIATDGAGTWIAVWTAGDPGDDTGTDADIGMAQSSDGGTTWTERVEINPNALTDIGNEFRPEVVPDGAGRWLAVWESRDSDDPAIGADGDIMVATSTTVGCGSAPAIGCRLPVQAGKSALTIKDRTPDVKDQMQWKWLTGEATVAADFGDPVASSDYALCVYDGSGELLVEALVPYGGSCAGRPCWKGIGNPAGSKGFKFGGDGAISSGITRILLRPGESGTAKIIVKGKRDALPLPALPLAVPVSVQLLGNGSCWSAVYSSAGVRRNDDEQFNGRSD